MPDRILIAEPAALVAELLGVHLRTLIPDAQVKVIGSVRELSQLQPEDFELVVLDLVLTDGDTVAWLNARTNRSKRSHGRVLILTASEKEVHFHGLFQACVAGIVHKSDGLDFFSIAMKTVLAGGSVCSPRIHEIRSRLSADPHHFSKILTRRELSVLQKIGSGHSVDEIARALSISRATVVDHRKKLMKKLSVHSQAQLTSYLLEKGFLLSPRLGRRPSTSPVRTNQTT